MSQGCGWHGACSIGAVMKIGNPSSGNQKSGVVGQTGVGGQANPFKKVMSDGPKAGLGQQKPAPVAAAKVAGPAKTPVLTAKPVLKKLPGGVTPLVKAMSKPLPPNVKSIQAAVTARAAARAEANAKAENLVELRSQHGEKAQAKYDSRLVDLICAELKAEFGNELSRPQAANSDRPVPAPVPSQPQATVTPITQASAKQEAALKAASAVQLIEKIEAFVKSQRPGIALTLDGSLGARVEIERLGPKEVALRVVGKNGPPAPEDIGRIREEMRARGLKVGALSVA